MSFKIQRERSLLLTVFAYVRLFYVFLCFSPKVIFVTLPIFGEQRLAFESALRDKCSSTIFIDHNNTTIVKSN